MKVEGEINAILKIHHSPEVNKVNENQINRIFHLWINFGLWVQTLFRHETNDILVNN